ncbi:hypothetical protein HY623_00720 [Candidatus Uhrbacteria bacterium]|nr:hypothetical protein [Candidatus Uhrbacteria bacterium]
MTKSPDRFSELTNRIFGEQKTLDALLKGGEKKEAIVAQLVSELRDDFPGQEDFVKDLSQMLAIEGDDGVTNRRDGALAVLTDFAFFDIIENQTAVAYQAYLDAVKQQDKDNNPFSGSIDALLEAGKIIGPFVFKANGNKYFKREKIIAAWEKVKDNFFDDDALHIERKLLKIKKSMKKNGALLLKVETLRNRKGVYLSRDEMAAMLKEPLWAIDGAIGILIYEKRVAARGRNNEEKMAFDDRVLALKEQGMTKLAIADELGVMESPVSEALTRLYSAGRIKKRGR